MEIASIFPTAIGKFELGRNFFNAESNFIAGLEMEENVGNLTSVDKNVLDAPEMMNLRAFVEESVSQYFGAVYEPDGRCKLRITQSWVNSTKVGEHHHRHQHQNSVVSGVLYVEADRERDSIWFYKNEYQQIAIHPRNINTFNQDVWWIQVRTGDLILFPSRLTHDVPKVKEGNRVSLSFNTFPVGSIGGKKNLNYLELVDLGNKNTSAL